MSALPLLLSAILAQASTGAVIRVGDLSLSSAEVTARAEDFLRRQGKTLPDADAFVGGVVDELLLAADAQRSGLAAKPLARAAVVAARAKVLSREYWEREFLSKAKPDEQLVRELFHETQDRVRLRLVVLATRVEAEAARARLAAGGEWPLEAGRSLHPSASKKGDTGLVGRRDLDPALAKVAFEIPKATLFGPVALALGFAVGEVTERTIADEKGLPEARPTLEAWARRTLAGASKSHFLEMSRKKHGVVLDEKFLVSLGKSTEVTDAQADRAIASIDGKPVPFREILPDLDEWRGASHGFGPSIRIRVAELHLDNRLLSDAGVEAHVDAIPEVASALRIAELTALARADAAAILAAAPEKKRAESIEKRLEKLRKQISVTIDRPAATAAVRQAAATANHR